ncbi:hypothetical protein LDC_2265, partial [sediment metagenome]
QHDKIYTLKDDTKKVVFVFSKGMGHIVKNYLSQQPENFFAIKKYAFCCGY